jgi:hypothetical protein
MYCGATVVVQEAIQAAAAATIPNLLKLARAAAQSSNYQEAYDYFTRVLELDAGNSESWTGKAEAAGRMSGQSTFRMPEMINYFRNALEVAPEDQRTQIRHEAAQVICRITCDDYMKMRSALSGAFWQRATWIFYLNRVRAIIQVLEDANRLIQNNTSLLKTLIWVCDDNSSRVYSQDRFGKRIRGPEFDSRWREEINAKKTKYTQELDSLNRPAALAKIEENREPAPAPISGYTASFPGNRVVFVGVGAIIVMGLMLIVAAIALNEPKTQSTGIANQATPVFSPSTSTSTPNSNGLKKSDPPKTISHGVTRKAYDLMREGMTKAQCDEIVGFSGKIYKTYHYAAGSGLGTGGYFVSWKKGHAEIAVQFDNGFLIMKFPENLN